MHVGKGKVFIARRQLLSATPDTNYTAEALRRCRLTVHVYQNEPQPSNRRRARLILPCLGRTEIDMQAAGEQFKYRKFNGCCRVLAGASARILPSRSEPAIVAGMAQATLGSKSTVDWESLVADYDSRLYRAIIPGFEDYNVRACRGGGFYLPNKAREGKFATATGKANFDSRNSDHQLAPGW